MAAGGEAGHLEVRLVRPEEHQEAGQVVLAAYQDLPGEHMSGGYAAQLVDVARRAVEAEVLVAVGADGIVGCATLVPGPWSPWAEQLKSDEAGLRMMAVRPDSQGRGVGAALLGACTGRAEALGRQALVLHSTPWMHAAHRLYLAHGFTRLPERDWLPVPEVPLLAFRLVLGRTGRA